MEISLGKPWLGHSKRPKRPILGTSSEAEDQVDKKKQPDVVVPTDIEERPDADVEKVIKVEEVTNQETSSDTPIIEKISGIFKLDQSSSPSSSDSESEKDDVKPVPHKEEMVHRKSEAIDLFI